MFDLKLLNIFDDEMSLSSKSVKLSTDSRSYSGEEVFFCLSGESFDGFNFVEPILGKGCEVIVFKNSEENLFKMEEMSERYDDIVFIGVDSPLLSLQELANARIKEFKSNDGFVFGITGSNGKTTTKEMLTNLLTATFGDEVHATKGNFNNHIGVPLTILAAPENCKYMVVEMGSNHLGEIGTLCKIAEPEFGIISSVGAAHIGLFGSIENIFNEKKSLYDFVLKNETDRSKFVINSDDQNLSRIPSNQKLIKFGTNGEVKTQFLKEEVRVGDSLTLRNKNIQEKYNLNNLISALLLCVNIFPNQTEDFLGAANEYTIPALNRSEWIQKNGKLIFLDAYNANPTSMEAALNSFIENLSRKNIALEKSLFILGDMNELGDYTEVEHKRIGTMLKKAGASQVAFVGRFSEFYQEGFSDGEVYPEKSLLEESWPNLSKKCYAIFIKASRSLQLESLIDIT
ncbi:UDP-N-acetylmuramoyl-tripeptide--D-alanyl-D-alanine ligase [Halobacteriovorax sp. JY17]|uniref:UDP-N-acetylmuramoyl-tripeptide--D-alanyl-D- alanine ligase n=1 Tax=Halobacteriovorax sp. JY17 TaxID=2014617 RepID=UPI000C3B7B75|nr:UDP-N-acetylmuramoyl-tripeptide--D-alanyl-D-alanine ligase [Halobacteriovorax sp. JY17]PIK14415.1 MAG: hypothetical protein CES88_08720 [Halobacteriovorax sp. JY17]